MRKPLEPHEVYCPRCGALPSQECGARRRVETHPERIAQCARANAARGDADRYRAQHGYLPKKARLAEAPPRPDFNLAGPWPYRDGIDLNVRAAGPSRHVATPDAGTQPKKPGKNSKGSKGGSSTRRRVLALYARDGRNCYWCGRALIRRDDFVPAVGRLPDDYPTLEHLVPRSMGGSDRLENLVLACPPCNVERGNDESWVPGRLAGAGE